jgi:hypothetical protein
MRRTVVPLLIVTLTALSAPSWANSESTAVEVASSAGSAFGTMIYAPLKATFCILGGIGSGFTAIASPPTAGKVAMATCGGSWIVTPNVVRGREPVRFIGDTTPNRAAAR